MVPYDIFRLINSQRLTEEEEAEFVQMEEYLADLVHEPADDFPWQRWEELSEKRVLSNLQEERPSQRLLRIIKGWYIELEADEKKLRLWPLTDANADAQTILMSRIERKQKQIETYLAMLDRMIASEREMFGPINVPALPTKAAASVPKPHSLLELCIGATLTERKGQAELINQMFDAAKQGVDFAPDRYATAAVAVYKLAEYLKVIEKGKKSTIWVPLIQEQYGVTVTEGQAKYSFNTPTKRVFIRAVKAAYEAYSKRYPHKAKGQQLPSGY